MDRRGGITFFRLSFFVLQCQKTFVGGTLVFQVCSGMERKLWLGGCYHVVLSKIFCLSVPKKFLRGTLEFDTFRYGKKSIDNMEGITFLRRRFFVSQWWKIFSRNPSVLERNSRKENFHPHEGWHHGLIGFFLSNSTETFCRGDFCVSEKFW